MTTETEPKLSRLDRGKIIARFVVKHSTSATVATAVAQNVSVEGRRQKAQILIGSYILAGIAADAAWNYVQREIDEAIEFAETARKKFKVEADVNVKTL
jgi:hypothetical protein